MEVSGELHAPAAVQSGNEPPIPIGYEAGWASESVWMLWSKEESLASAENQTPAVCPVARHYTD
jgi:hypothetical protein